MNAHHTAPVVENNEHPLAAKIGKITGRLVVPASLVLGTAYVVIKTKIA